MRNIKDTIAAVATSPGEGGIAIIRISGKDAEKILKSIFRPRNAVFEHARMRYGRCVDKDGNEIDEVMAVLFRAPKSYTREDVAEIHCHGGRIVTGMVLESAVKAGARPAVKGEFTYRAFMNGRIDLSGAEAVMGIIGAGSERAARASLRQLKGGASSLIGKSRDKLFELMTLIDAALDFPDEIDEEVTQKRIVSELESIIEGLEKSCDPRAARIAQEGARVVIAGRPNVGKSSIMNALLHAERAIVTDIPGTTRDIVSESVTLDGLRITLTDTAGIRETGDIIEKIGVDRARQALADADCVLMVLDSSTEMTDEDKELLSLKDERFIIVSNKNDLRRGEGDVCVSALTGEGMDALINRIKEICQVDEDDEKLMTLRHIDCAERAKQALIRAKDAAYLELMREDITEALNDLSEISGENVSESVIDGIFERFCVGK